MSSGSLNSEEKRQFHYSAQQAVLEALGQLDPKARDGADLDASPRRLGGPADPTESVISRSLVLVDHGDGALEWTLDSGGRSFTSPRLGQGDPTSGPEPLVYIPLEILNPNQIVARLIEWDGKLTPHQGLRRMSSAGALEPIASVPPTVDPVARPGGILLFIHGTFSNGEGIIDQLQKVEADAEFFAWANARYEHILSFDHATLSVSPVMNALDLSRLFAEVRGPVDVICHSRGGLVARWWLEAFGGATVGPRRTIFVASPLRGTSLASPAKIREAFDLFSTVGAHLKSVGEVASVYLPFMTVAIGLMQVFVAVTGAAARTPFADLFFCAVPGLGGMSRVSNNSELDRLQGGSIARPDYFAIRSDFRMDPAGWKFWRHFSKEAVGQWGADQIFDQPNDLVVDNRSTIELFRGKGLHPARILDIASNGKVHHTNYFLQPKVILALKQFLADRPAT